MVQNKPGPKNLITDVPGLSIGNMHSDALKSGVTVLLPDQPITAAVDVRGGGTGTRETDTLALSGSVSEIHGLVLSGGSAFGLNAAGGVQSYLKERNIGFEVGTLSAEPARVPIVPQAILFDLLNGGDKDWGRRAPYEDMAYAACRAAGHDFDIGATGAGYGATTANGPGGLGSASLTLDNNIIIGALVAVNAAGSVTVALGNGNDKHFWAAPLEIGDEFGGLGLPSPLPREAHDVRLKGGVKANSGQNTTLGIIATNAKLDKVQLNRLAIMAQTGLARAIWPVHTPLDGDVVFAISTGAIELNDPLMDLAVLGAHSANTLARAVARGVYAARCT